MRTLFIADPHFGKAASFRAAGMPVPTGTSASNADRLTQLLEQTLADRLVVLGDLLHDDRWRDDETMRSLRDWRDRHDDVEVVLVRGNHDHKAGDPPAELRIRCVEEPHTLGPFALQHDPALPAPSTPTLAGHLHPAVMLRDGHGHRMRCHCFLFGPQQAVLPAFGAFTGAHVIRPAADDRVFVIGAEDLVEVRGAPRSTTRT